MSNEFGLDWSESSVKSDAKRPPAEYDIVISRFSPPGECEAKVDELMQLCDQLEGSLRQSQQRAESLAASAISHLTI
jgi:hypothetical protein